MIEGSGASGGWAKPLVEKNTRWTPSFVRFLLFHPQNRWASVKCPRARLGFIIMPTKAMQSPVKCQYVIFLILLIIFDLFPT